MKLTKENLEKISELYISKFQNKGNESDYEEGYNTGVQKVLPSFIQAICISFEIPKEQEND